MYRIESKPDETGLIHLLEERIYEHNSATIQKYDGHFFSSVAKDENNGVVAGIAGWTWAGACEITQLWVSQKYRGRGLGKMLLDAAAGEARSKGCETILVKTYSFQAPAFYLKNGYQIEHALDNFPYGHTYYTLTKKIIGA